MNLKTTFLNVFILCSFMFTGTVWAQTTSNRALEATVSTSHVSPWEILGAVNDGVSSTSSTAKPAEGAYGNWNGEGFYDTYNWVQYEWEHSINIESTNVFWWSDGGGISQPTDAYIEYWNGISWVNAGAIGLELDVDNSLDVGVWASKIRINMKSNTSTGIIEWRVMATDETPCDASEITTLIQVDDSQEEPLSNVVASVGDNVTITAQTTGEGELYWFNPDGEITTGITSLTGI